MTASLLSPANEIGLRIRDRRRVESILGWSTSGASPEASPFCPCCPETGRRSQADVIPLDRRGRRAYSDGTLDILRGRRSLLKRADVLRTCERLRWLVRSRGPPEENCAQRTVVKGLLPNTDGRRSVDQQDWTDEYRTLITRSVDERAHDAADETGSARSKSSAIERSSTFFATPASVVARYWGVIKMKSTMRFGKIAPGTRSDPRGRMSVDVQLRRERVRVALATTPRSHWRIRGSRYYSGCRRTL